MKIVDLNVLIYVVNSDARQHAIARDWWNAAANGDETIGLTWVVLPGFLRIITNARIFPMPLTPESAMARIDTWLALRPVTLIREKHDHWPVLRELLSQTGTAANLSTDAHLARSLSPTARRWSLSIGTSADFRAFTGSIRGKECTDRSSHSRARSDAVVPVCLDAISRSAR